jgi:hypothetical protein
MRRPVRVSTPWLVVLSALMVGLGTVIGLSIASWFGPLPGGMRIGGMTMPGGPGATMPEMAMPPSPPLAAAPQTADLSVAHADVEVGRFVQAIAIYERVLAADPHDLEARVHLGVSLAGVGQVERGLAELDRALAMDADNLHALWSKALTLFDEGRYAVSIPVWERVAAVAANSPDAAVARGYVLRARERLEGRPKGLPDVKSP